jgi:endonuclease YncB( thermonuclease family)
MTVWQRWLACLVLFGLSATSHTFASDTNASDNKNEIIRVIKPGIVDIQISQYLLRIRAWGVSFPSRGQPGYEAALAFTEKKLLSRSPILSIKREFDELNLKVVDIEMEGSQASFSKEAISYGIGWHNEEETNRYGPFLMAQLKAKRLKSGIWGTEFDYKIPSLAQVPIPKLPRLYDKRQGFVPSLSYWVTSFGKIHRPGCSFYERGRGMLSSKPKGNDCRICGGRKPKNR